MAPRGQLKNREEYEADRRGDLKRLGSYQQVLQTFKQYDIDGNGILSFKELHRLMKDLNQGKWTEDESHKLFTNIDKDNNGAIDIDEFINYIFSGTKTGMAGLSEYERVMQEFRKFDNNKNGTLDRAEFTRVMCSLKPGQWGQANTEAVFDRVDLDHSGEVDLDELVAYLFGVPSDRARQAEKAEHGNSHGPLVVIEFVCGPSGPEAAVKLIANSWGKKFGTEVAVMKKVDKNLKTIGSVIARDGEIVFWDMASMMAYRENPFLTMQTMKEWTNDMSRRHIPRLIEGAHAAAGQSR